MITATQEAMKLRLGVDGYAFANVDPVPTPNNETKEISLTFVVDPENRVYVRRMNFNGTSGVNDEVFRREMRQLEGGYLSNSAVERSKQRIQRLPFIKKVEVETNRCRARPIWWTWTSRSRRACPASSAAASATPSRSRSS